jgi:hydroxymethylpyrimidine/phosphomethylpyrimidine kinase / thiaminase
MLEVVHESSMHKSFCAKWGITEEELENTPESPTTTAYGAYLIDMGLQGANLISFFALLTHLSEQEIA